MNQEFVSSRLQTCALPHGQNSEATYSSKYDNQSAYLKPRNRLMNQTERNAFSSTPFQPEDVSRKRTQKRRKNKDLKDDHPQKRQKKTFPLLCLSLVNLLSLAISIVVLLLFTLDYRNGGKIKPVGGALSTLHQNLMKHPIIDLITVSQKEDCPKDYEVTPIGLCSPPKRENISQISPWCKCLFTCSNEEKFNPIELFNWQHSFICTRRAVPGKEYIQQQVCPSGFKECSPGFCFLDSLECPITSLIASENKSGPGRIFTNGVNTRYLVSLRAQGKSPLVDFAISPNGPPCFDSKETLLGLKDAFMLQEGETRCKRYGFDTEWSFPIDVQEKNEFLKDNDIEQFRASSPPDFVSGIQNSQVVFSGRNRIAVANKNECLNLDARFFGPSLSNAYAELKDQVEGIPPTCLFSLCWMVIVFLKCSVNNKSDFNEGLGWLIVISGFTMLYLFSQRKDIHNSFSVLSRSAQYFQTLNEMGCFPVGQPSQVLVDFSLVMTQVVTPLYTYSRVLFFFYICQTVLAYLLRVWL